MQHLEGGPRSENMSESIKARDGVGVFQPTCAGKTNTFVAACGNLLDVIMSHPPNAEEVRTGLGCEGSEGCFSDRSSGPRAGGA